MLQQNLDRINQSLESQLAGITEELRKDWAIHPCTKALLTYLLLTLETHKMSWANGGFTGESQGETLQLNSAAVGKCTALFEIEENIKAIGGQKEDD